MNILTDIRDFLFPRLCMACGRKLQVSEQAESVAIIGKRANQISVEIKNDLSKKLAEFASYNDNLEEVFENREQIEISRYYEKLPKPTLIATQEYIEGKIYYRNPAKEKEKLQ